MRLRDGPRRAIRQGWRLAGVPVLTNEIAIDARPASGNGSAPGLTSLFLILGAILAVRILGIAFSTSNFHYDEAQYWYWSQEFDFGYFSQPPLLMWLIGSMTAVCGDGEECIRVFSPFLATAGAFLTFILARRLYDRQVAFWAAIVYATLPVVSAFAMVATPETTLAVFVIAGLVMLSIHFERPTMLSGAGLGIVLGFGLLLDYVMVYLPICSALYLAATPNLRRVAYAPATWLAIATAIMILAPNILWNVRNEMSAVTAFLPIANWTFRHINADATLAFIVLQFVLFGPILFFVLMRSVIARRTIAPRAAADRFLLFHSVPILAALLLEALFFRAKAHWALPAYPAAAVFVTALLLRHGFQRLIMISTGLHIAALAGIIGLSVFANRLAAVPAVNSLVGWKNFAENLAEAAAVSDIDIVVLRGGSQVAEAAYYLRGMDIEIRAFSPRGRRPTNTFEKRLGWAYGDPETILLATERDPSAFGIPLGTADRIGEFPVQSYLSDNGIYSLYRVNPPADTPFPQ